MGADPLPFKVNVQWKRPYSVGSTKLNHYYAQLTRFVIIICFFSPFLTNFLCGSFFFFTQVQIPFSIFRVRALELHSGYLVYQLIDNPNARHEHKNIHAHGTERNWLGIDWTPIGGGNTRAEPPKTHLLASSASLIQMNHGLGITFSLQSLLDHDTLG